MTTKQFIAKHNGEYIERFDSNAKNQCIDLVLLFVDEVLELGSLIPIGVGIAYDLWTEDHKLMPHVSKRDNTPDFVPQEGDIVVWATSYGPAGHTAVCTGSGDKDKFECFSQNDSLGSSSQLKRYSYNHIAGFLRPKALESVNDKMVEVPAGKYEELVMKATEADEVFKYFSVQMGVGKHKEIEAKCNEKEKVISKQSETLLKLREEQITLSEQTKLLGEEVQDKERLRAKWYDAYGTERKAKEFYMEQVRKLQEQIKKHDLSQYPVKQLLHAAFKKLIDKYLT